MIDVNGQRRMLPVALFSATWSLCVSGTNLSHGYLIYEWSPCFDVLKVTVGLSKDNSLDYMTMSYINDSCFLCSAKGACLPLTTCRIVRIRATLKDRYAK